MSLLDDAQKAGGLNGSRISGHDDDEDGKDEVFTVKSLNSGGEREREGEKGRERERDRDASLPVLLSRLESVEVT